MNQRVIVQLSLCAGLGVALGLGSSLLNNWDSSIGTVLSKVIGVGWAWMAVGILCGWIARSLRWGALEAAVALMLAVTSYYVADLQQGVYDTPVRSGWSAREPMLGELAYWLPRSSIAGVATGLIGAWCRRSDWSGLMARLVVPFGAAVQMIMFLSVDRPAAPDDAVRFGVHAITLALAFAFALLVVRQWVIGRRGTAVR